VDTAIRRAIAALTLGTDAQRHFDLAADRISRTLLDVVAPAIEGIEIGVRAEPSRLVGGDYIDLLPSGRSGLLFALGDASGKSLAAALNALMLRYLVRGLVTALGTQALDTIVQHANTVLAQDVDDDSFVTFILGAIDPDLGQLRLVNAGHEPALILRRTSATVEVTQSHGIVLGVMDGATYPQETVAISRGDTIVLYTDGLTEATDQRGELFTVDRLCEEIVRNRSCPAKRLADAVFDTVRAYAGHELRDDATILVLRLTV